jgi:hypothetical protein
VAYDVVSELFVKDGADASATFSGAVLLRWNHVVVLHMKSKLSGEDYLNCLVKIILKEGDDS